jgi:integrase
MWLETVRANKEPLTYRGYEMVVRVHLKPALGHRRLSQLGPLEIQRFLDAKHGTLAPGTVRRLWVVLTSALTRARKLGIVARNIASSEVLEVPGFDPAPANILTLAEARTFLAGIRGDRFHALHLTAVVLGQRQSSLLGLRWKDVDEENGRLRLPMRLIRFEGAWQLRPGQTRTKKTARSLPLPAPVAAALRDHRARQQRERDAAGSEWLVMEHDGREVELVFTSPTGRPLHGRDVTERFQRRLEEAGLDRRRFHDLRHSAASVMLALKIPLKVVSEVLAHSGIQITADLYGHLEDDVLRQQLAILDAAWADDPVADGEGQSAR